MISGMSRHEGDMSCPDQDQQIHHCCPDNQQTVAGDSLDPHELRGEPLQGLKLAPHAALETAQQKGRLKCSKCGGSRMFFCYTCCSLVGISQEEVPTVKLPVKVDIIKHPNETDGKSTAIHAKILAPDDVTIYTYPCIPEYERDKVVLVFPGPGSMTIGDMVKRWHHRADKSTAADEPCRKRLRVEKTPGATHIVPNPGSGAPGEARGVESGKIPLKRVVFIDSTWNQTNRIITDERLQSLLQVELKTRKTCFWRTQKGKPATYLATIEAIYYFLKDYHKCCLAEYSGEYDNLLFFYSYLHSLINKAKSAAGKL